jgi:hypothetical protein
MGEPSLAEFGGIVLTRGSQTGRVLATGSNPLVVMAADSRLRRANGAQAGSRRLHGQVFTRGFAESVPFEA